MSHKIAHLSLDFPGVAWRTELRRMDAKSLEVTLKLYLKEMRERLEQAASIAMAAETCAKTGNVEKGIEIVLESAQLITK
jgi:hypothetical protein